MKTIILLLFVLCTGFQMETLAQQIQADHKANRLEGVRNFSLEEGRLSFVAVHPGESIIVIKSDNPLRLRSEKNVKAQLIPGWDGSLGYKMYGIRMRVTDPGACEVHLESREAPHEAVPTSRREMKAFKSRLASRSSGFPMNEAAFNLWQNNYRDTLIRVLTGGEFPERVPGDIKLEYKKEYKQFWLYSYSYQSQLDRRNKVLLSLPKKVKKAPLLVALHGHETTWGTADSAAFREGHIDDFCAYFANRGWAVLQAATMDHQLQHAGWTLQGEWTWDAMVALDLFSVDAAINENQIAVCGLSTGGHLAMNLLALDDRVQAGVVGCILSTWNHYEKRMRIPPHCDCGIHGQLSPVLEQCDWAALAAPKPVQFQHGYKDASFCPGADVSLLDLQWNTGILPPEEYEAMFTEIERAYRILGKEGQLVNRFFDGPHSINNKMAYDWITRSFGIPSLTPSVNHPGLMYDRSETECIDLDGDGDPDVLRTISKGGIPIQWIDDDDDMRFDDWEGDADSDCLMVDRNQDGRYGDSEDLMVDWNDEDMDGRADIQVIADNRNVEDGTGPPGHFMISVDTDHDGVYNYIDWTNFKLEAWEHSGKCNFFSDYSGQSLFLKIHASTFDIEDLRYNWENPFLFYDWDHDGLTEMAIRLLDSPSRKKTGRKLSLSGQITEAYLSFDMDNDSRPQNEFDFDMSLKFAGSGFAYQDHKHSFQSLKGLPAADTFFRDPRWRQMSELIYVGHNEAYNKVFKEGVWDECWFVFDEDDDCHRWERVEFYAPKNLFLSGPRKGGLDDNPQAEVSGDRGEWDLDFSGRGDLYISNFDGKLHLFGAETGAWRIDKQAKYYQGWQGWRGGGDFTPNDPFLTAPEKFPTIRYSDSDMNGFFDVIEYDMDGDTLFEQCDSLFLLGLSDSVEVYHTAGLSHENYRDLYKKMSSGMWQRAMDAIPVAEAYGVDTGAYSDFLSPTTEREKYHHGFWLNHNIFWDLLVLESVAENTETLTMIKAAYYSGNWKNILNNQIE